MSELLEGLWASADPAVWGSLVLVALIAVSAVRGWWAARTRARTEADRAAAIETRFDTVDALGDGLAILGRGGQFTYVNQTAARLLGSAAPRELYGRSWHGVFPPEGVEVMEREVLPGLEANGRWVGEVMRRRGDGTALVLELAAANVRGGGMSWVLRDASSRSTTERALRTKAERYRATIRSAGIPVVLLDGGRRVVDASRDARALLANADQSPEGQDFCELAVPAEEHSVVADRLNKLLSRGGTETFEVPLSSEPERRIVWNATLVSAREDEEAGFVLVGQDVTGLKQAEEALTEQSSLFRLLANNASDLVMLHEPDGRVLYASPSCTGLLGFTQEELEGRDLYQIGHSDDWGQIQASLGAAASGHQQRLNLRLRTANGEFLWFETLLRPIADASGRMGQLQSSSRDISERRAFEVQLEHQALHEPLTGLPNRTLFMDRVDQAITRGKREGTSVAVMFLDLDRFKVVNDSMGHAVGDRLIAAVAHRIKDTVRTADTVARIGGDEFGILLEFNISRQDAQLVADRILKQLEPPFTMAGTEMFISASIGIAFSTPETETPEDLLRYADVAMYRAKDDGSGRYRIYDPEIDARATRRLEIETELRRALEQDELIVHYQPLVSLHSGRVSGVEALVRWEHPERGRIGPDEFIPLAEETGLIVPLGYWVIRRACEDRKLFEVAGTHAGSILISVNLSTRQFEQPDLEDQIRRILVDTDTDPDRLQLEVTESELMQSSGRIQDLKTVGIRVAIDDFGTGYSSLSYLRNLRVDSLKIDRSFVDGLGKNREDTAIVQTVVTLADSLELDVTAEGVEDEDQLSTLRELGCDTVQGYFFARPTPASEIVELLESDPTW
jgi:diguanylate cyclase (GGDEF)-like protein/PAS domain S-box-containing protein